MPAIEWTKTKDGFTEPSGRFVISMTKNRHYFLRDTKGATQGKITSLGKSKELAETILAAEPQIDTTPTPSRPTEPPDNRTVQEKLDELVWKNGANILERADCSELLASVNLTRNDVTAAMVRIADHHATERLKQSLKEYNALPDNQRMMPGKDGKAVLTNAVFVGDPELDPSANFGKTSSLSTAVSDNVSETETQSFVEESNMTTVLKTAARSLLVALGKDAAKWSSKKCTIYLGKKLPETLKDAKDPEGDDMVLLKKISKAVEGGGKVMVVDKMPKAEKPKAEKGTPEKNGTAPTKTTGKPRGKAVLFDQPATSILRWMGKNKFTVENAKEAFKNYNIKGVADGTFGTAISHGKRGERSLPKLTKDQEKELMEFRK